MTGRMIKNLIEVRQGDSFNINLQIFQEGKPVNLTGFSLLMQVRDNDNNLIFSVYGIGVDTANGKMALLLTPEHTKIAVGDYKTDIQLSGSDGSVNTIFPANVNQVAVFRITPQITEA